MRKTIKGPDGFYLVLDTGDPDTPALVFSTKRSEASATYNCAVESGELTERRGTVDLTDAALKWLDGLADEVDEAYSKAREGIKEYE